MKELLAFTSRLIEIIRQTSPTHYAAGILFMFLHQIYYTASFLLVDINASAFLRLYNRQEFQ